MEKNVYTGVNLTNFPSEEYFHINSCGMQTNHKQHFTILRQEGRVDFHILYIVKGGLTAVYAGKEASLLPGNFILYPPGMPQRYTFPEAMETITFWVHFTGRTAPEILDGLGLSGGVYSKQFYCEETRLRGIAEKAKQGGFEANGALLHFLHLLAQQNREQPSARGIDILLPALRRMETLQKCTVAECASLCAMSESRFSHLFRQIMGVSPHQYFLKMRLEQAQGYLQDSDLSIAQIAQLTGFEDALYFSRLFKKYFGVAPSSYRGK